MFFLILVGISMGLGNFACAVGIGLNGLTNKTRIQTAIIFGFFETIMPIIGLLLGRRFSPLFGIIGRYSGAGLLILIGIYLLLSAKNKKIQKNKFNNNYSFPVKYLILIGFANSIDNLIIGFAISFSHYALFQVALIAVIISVCLSLIGLEVGHKLGAIVEKWSAKISGLILILIGLVLGFGFI
jgi:putative Mn2+ efflux pump MntP